MTDIAERLREIAWSDEAHSSHMYEEAADEIQRLRAEVKALKKDAGRLKFLLRKIAYGKGADGMAWASMGWCVEVYSMSPPNLLDAIDEAMKK